MPLAWVLVATLCAAAEPRHVAVLPVSGMSGSAADELRGALESGVDASGYLREPRATADDVIRQAKRAGLSCKRADAECWKKVAIAAGLDAIVVPAVAKSKLYLLFVDVDAPEPKLDAIDYAQASDARALVARMLGPHPADAPPLERPPPIVVMPEVVEEPAQRPTPPTRSEQLRVLVLELRNDGIDDAGARLLRDELTMALADAAPSAQVLSIEDVRRQLDVEGEKALAGCSDASCVSEIAGALGAEYIVYGNVGRLAEMIIVQLTLHDARATTAAGRVSAQVRRVDALPAEARAAASKLAQSLPAEARAAPLSAWVVAGAVVAGAGALTAAVGGAVALACNAIVSDVRFVRDGGPNGDQRLAARGTGQAAVVVLAVGSAVALGGAATMTLGGLE